MVSMQKILKWGGLTAVLVAMTGCVVLPYGHGGRHGHGRGGDRHDLRAPEKAPIMREAPRDGRQRPGY